MEARDFRGIGRAAQEELRRRALVSDRAAGAEPGRRRRRWSGCSGRRSTSGSALPRAGRGRRARRPAGVAAARQGAVDGRGGRPGPRLDPRPDAGPAEAAVRLVDQPGGARPDRAALRQDARPVDGAALPAALGHDPAKAPGPGQGALSPRRSRPGWSSTTRRSPSAPRPRVRRSTGATRPGSPTRTRSGAPMRPEGQTPWSSGPPSGSPRA